MAYADYSYYENEYLLEKEPVIPEDDFLFWEKRARREVDNLTYDRISSLDTIPDLVKDCVCEVAELLYRADHLDSMNLESGASGPLASYSNDGQSGSFDTSQSAFTADGRKAETLRIIRMYLLNTGLMYKGVNWNES